MLDPACLTSNLLFMIVFRCDVLLGDVKDDLYDLILEKWPEIDEEAVEDLGDVKAR